jgi:lipoic acid synthetase
MSENAPITQKEKMLVSVLVRLYSKETLEKEIRDVLESYDEKSNLILGMGETRDEVSQALKDLRDAGCDLITITQYLRPSAKHHPVIRWVKPNEFVELSKEAQEIGFLGVMSGPLVRSSYRAGRLYNQAMAARAVK